MKTENVRLARNIHNGLISLPTQSAFHIVY